MFRGTLDPFTDTRVAPRSPILEMAHTYLDNPTEALQTRTMAKLKLNLQGSATWREYFKDVAARLEKMGASQNMLARQMGVDAGQISRYFNDEEPNPRGTTIVAIEEALVTLRRRKAQERRLPPE